MYKLHNFQHIGPTFQLDAVMYLNYRRCFTENVSHLEYISD